MRAASIAASFCSPGSTSTPCLLLGQFAPNQRVCRTPTSLETTMPVAAIDTITAVSPLRKTIASATSNELKAMAAKGAVNLRYGRIETLSKEMLLAFQEYV